MKIHHASKSGEVAQVCQFEVVFFLMGQRKRIGEVEESQLITCLAMIRMVVFGGIMAKVRFKEDIQLGTVQILRVLPMYKGQYGGEKAQRPGVDSGVGQCT